MSDTNFIRTVYRRWGGMSRHEVLDEMAILFHLAVKIEEVKDLDAAVKAIRKADDQSSDYSARPSALDR